MTRSAHFVCHIRSHPCRHTSPKGALHTAAFHIRSPRHRSPMALAGGRAGGEEVGINHEPDLGRTTHRGRHTAPAPTCFACARGRAAFWDADPPHGGPECRSCGRLRTWLAWTAWQRIHPLVHVVEAVVARNGRRGRSRLRRRPLCLVVARHICASLATRPSPISILTRLADVASMRRYATSAPHRGSSQDKNVGHVLEVAWRDARASKVAGTLLHLWHALSDWGSEAADLHSGANGGWSRGARQEAS